jgi:hypothetical protein
MSAIQYAEPPFLSAVRLDVDALADRVSDQVMTLAVEQRPASKRRGRRPSASQPVGDLVSSLARAGWGVLEGREWRPVRSILEALARMCRDAHSDLQGTITTTARQVYTQAGYGERQARDALHWMEDMGLIVWWRGGIEAGQPRPGVMKVVKKKLVEWIMLARPIHDEDERRHRDETARRLRRLRSLRLASRLPRSLHAAGSASLSSLREREGGAARAPAPPSTPSTSFTPTDEETTMTARTAVPDSVRLRRLRDAYMASQGMTDPESIAWAHRHSAKVQEWDRKIALARRAERRPEERLTDVPLW